MRCPPQSPDRVIARSPEGSGRLDPQPLEARCRHTGGLFSQNGEGMRAMRQPRRRAQSRKTTDRKKRRAELRLFTDQGQQKNGLFSPGREKRRVMQPLLR